MSTFGETENDIIEGRIAKAKKRLSTVETQILGYAAAIRQALIFGEVTEINVDQVTQFSNLLAQARTEYDTIQKQVKDLEARIGR